MYVDVVDEQLDWQSSKLRTATWSHRQGHAEDKHPRRPVPCTPARVAGPWVQIQLASVPLVLVVEQRNQSTTTSTTSS